VTVHRRRVFGDEAVAHAVGCVVGDRLKRERLRESVKDLRIDMCDLRLGKVGGVRIDAAAIRVKRRY
jgi:hypothetical protein